MTARRHPRVIGTAVALFAIVAMTMPSTVAQDATPVAQPVAPARPAHIHSGDCAELGDVVEDRSQAPPFEAACVAMLPEQVARIIDLIASQRRDLAVSCSLRRPSLIFFWFSGLDSSR